MKLALALFLGAWSLTASSQTFRVPALTGPVVDEARLLDPRVRDELSNAIADFRNRGGAQITVLTLPNLGGLEIEQASIKVTDAWQLGGKKTDDGVLLLVAQEERSLRIEVGQGMEGNLTDLHSKRIIDGVIIPEFKAGDPNRGIVNGVVAIAQRTNPDVPFSISQSQPRQEFSGHTQRRGGWKFFWLVFVFFVLLSRFGRMFFLPALLLGSSRGSSGWGGGGFGGGGGGWGGGGGGFSGGGASGKW